MKKVILDTQKEYDETRVILMDISEKLNTKKIILILLVYAH